MASPYSTRAFSGAKLTVAVTPSSLLSFLSIPTAHDPHVIPSIDSSRVAALVGACHVYHTPLGYENAPSRSHPCDLGCLAAFETMRVLVQRVTSAAVTVD